MNSSLERLTIAFIAILFIFITPLLAANEPRPTTGVHIDRYMGRWYDVRSIPNDFQKGCTKTVIDYSLEHDGTIRVANSCHVVSDDGIFEKDTTVLGRGWVKNSDNSVLKVSFSCMIGLCVETLGADYWILELGPLNHDGLYSWAIVGSPTRQYGWILSRTPSLDDATMEQIEVLLRAQGYNPDAFQMTVQN